MARSHVKLEATYSASSVKRLLPPTVYVANFLKSDPSSSRHGVQLPDSYCLSAFLPAVGYPVRDFT